MKKTTYHRILFISIFLGISINSFSQVGVGTTTPAPGSMLDIESTDKGLLIPRIALTSTNIGAPITPAPSLGLLVFNTSTSGAGATAVSEGFYYWDGSQWVRLQTATNYWKLDGNDDAVEGVNFLGTTDNTNLEFRTNNVGRMRIPGNRDQLQAMGDGTNANPFYSWSTDPDVGMWRPGDNQMALSAGGNEFLRINGTTNELIINEGGAQIDTRIETQGNANMFFVDGTNNRIGINTNTPQTAVHIAGNNQTVRIDELNQVNNVHYTTSDFMPVYVNTDGDLSLQPSLVQNFAPINMVDFINPAISIQSATGEGVFSDIETVTINLTQESLVQVNYQMSVDITRHDGTQIVDGATRLFRSWVEVNGTATHIAYDSGTYNNNHLTGPYANENFYLNGNGYIQLSPGTHELKLRVLGFAGGSGGTHSYRLNFGANTNDRLLISVHR
ncbi:MAG: hypothetical protein WDZ45_01195 [Flavobacteriaceae bacterium]